MILQNISHPLILFNPKIVAFKKEKKYFFIRLINEIWSLKQKQNKTVMLKVIECMQLPSGRMYQIVPNMYKP